MNNGSTILVIFVGSLLLASALLACLVVSFCDRQPFHRNICVFEVETQLKYKNTKFESSAKTHFLVSSWVSTSDARIPWCACQLAPPGGALAQTCWAPTD